MTDQDAPSPSQITDYIVQTFPGVDVVTALGATFFSLDPDKHWPNFATIVTTDEHDLGNQSDLAARGLYRLNIGVGPQTFKRLVDPSREYDFRQVDTLMPHPVYAKQRWLCVINPTRRTFDEQLRPLLNEAYDLIARRRPRGTQSVS